MQRSRISRRSFLHSAAGLTAAALVSRRILAHDRAYRIDVHFHHLPPEWMQNEVVAKALNPQILSIAKHWTPTRALEEMDKNEVALAVSSVPNPGVWFGDRSQSRRLARICNEFGAQMCIDHPQRFGFFAALPFPDIDGCLQEIAYSLDVLKAKGLGIFTSYGDKWPADSSFSPIWEELNRRKAVVYLHPTAPSCCRSLMPDVPALLLEHPVDTSRAMLQWILTRSSALYPHVRLIFSHAGGVLMAGVGRLQVLADTQESMHLPKSFSAELGQFYYETSSSSDPVTTTALRSYVPLSHILLGTDTPFIGSIASNIEQLHHLTLSREQILLIERDNAMTLFGKDI